MARHPASLKTVRALPPAAPSARLLLASGLVVLLSCASCSREPQPRVEQFVGQWKSSRLAAKPLHMLGNGEWEIRADEGGPLQYGVWQVQGRRMLWTIRLGGRVTHDENAILSVGPRFFELREADGSVTRFDRIE